LKITQKQQKSVTMTNAGKITHHKLPTGPALIPISHQSQSSTTVQVKPAPPPVNNIWEKRREEQRLSMEREKMQMQQQHQKQNRGGRTGRIQQTNRYSNTGKKIE
jgi:mannosyltransferase OCH1-like enzyme